MYSKIELRLGVGVGLLVPSIILLRIGKLLIMFLIVFLITFEILNSFCSTILLFAVFIFVTFPFAQDH